MNSKIFLLFCLISLTFAETEVCLNKSPCKCVLAENQVIDISLVGLIGFPRFDEIRGSEKDTHLYSYNPCYSFTSLAHEHTIQKNGNKPCVNAAACIKSPGGSSGEAPEEYSIGVQSEGVFGSLTENEKVQFYINYTVPGVDRILMVKLNCSEKSENHVLQIQSEETEKSTLTVMLLNSKCACPGLCASSEPDPPNEGMSTGSKLLIAFFTIVFAYFLIGMIYNFCNGAQGLELVPNYEFWNELPKLIIDGVAFTCTCFGKRTAYGEV